MTQDGVFRRQNRVLVDDFFLGKDAESLSEDSSNEEEGEGENGNNLKSEMSYDCHPVTTSHLRGFDESYNIRTDPVTQPQSPTLRPDSGVPSYQVS